jgi:hypothetical protein
MESATSLQHVRITRGVARDSGGFVIMPNNSIKDDTMALDFSKLSHEELLAAESAVLTMRTLMDAARLAPHGHGMENMEVVIQNQGKDLLRRMLSTATEAQGDTQKKTTDAAVRAVVEKMLPSNTSRKKLF